MAYGRSWTQPPCGRLIVATLSVIIVLPAMAQGPAVRPQPDRLAAGKLLVARRNLPDPNFATAVILLIRYDAKGAMGVALNRPTDIPISRVFEGAGSSAIAYAGGPVGTTGAVALLRSNTKPDGGEHVFGEVYMLSSRAAVETALAAGSKPATFRVYVGYSGWGAGQLDREVKLGMWHIFAGETGLVFDDEPDTLWPRLIRRTELRIALAPAILDP